MPLRQVLRHPLANAESRESTALLVGAATLIIATGIALLVFWGTTMSISGAGSIGQFIAIGSAIAAVLVFLGARSLAEAGPSEDRMGERMRWFDAVSVAIAHGIIALLGWIGMADIVERCFVGAEVFPVAGAVLAGVAIASTAYVVTLSAANMTPTLLSLVLMVFLVVGILASMLSASDDQWWKLHLSSLGVTDDISAMTFNITVIIAGLMLAAVAHFGTIALPAASARAARGRRIIRLELTAMGVLLCGVGLFPVDRFATLHNVSASGMAVLFIAMVIGLRRNVPTTPNVFLTLGYVFVACIVVLAVLFTTGYYNLTAVELIAFLIIFSWLLLFLRNSGGGAAAPREHTPKSPRAAIGTPQ